MGRVAFLKGKGTFKRAFWMGRVAFLRSKGAFLKPKRTLASRAANGSNFSGLSLTGSAKGFTGDLLARLWILGYLGFISLVSFKISLIAAVTVDIVPTPMAKTFWNGN